jgi:hypothetical protein
MKLDKKYATLIVVIIILIFLFGFSYFNKFNYKPPATGGTQSPKGEIPLEEIPQHKTFSFASASCSVSGNSDTVRFKIQSTGIDIGLGEIAAYLDDGGTPCNFKDSNGNSIDNIELKADSTSAEFSCTTTDHKSSRKITVSSPAGSINKIVTCS